MGQVTEQRHVHGPIVYGFLRLPTARARRKAALQTALIEFCDQHELTLHHIFTEQTDDAAADETFAGLLAVLARRESYGVVVPSSAHLGGRSTAAERCRRIATTASRLLIVRTEAATMPSTRRVRLTPVTRSR
jgi:hypothetical protein